MSITLHINQSIKEYFSLIVHVQYVMQEENNSTLLLFTLHYYTRFPFSGHRKSFSDRWPVSLVFIPDEEEM